MAFSLKNWHNQGETPVTPISAASLKDLEKRVTDYADAKTGTASATLTSLRALVAVEETNYYLSEKGKEGWWRLDPTDSSSEDNGGTIIVTTGTQRLKRIIPPGAGYAPEWFGAKGDWKDTTPTLGTGTDDTEAFQKCVNALIAADGGCIELSSKGYYLKGTVYFNQPVGSSVTWVPIIVKGLPSEPGLSRGHSSRIVRTTTGDCFRVNLNASEEGVLGPAETYEGFSVENVSFIGKSVVEGVPVTGMVGIRGWRTRFVVKNVYASRFDYLMLQPETDSKAQDNYCDISTYENISCSFSTKSGMKLYKNDSGKVRGFTFESPLSTVTGALEFYYGAGAVIEDLLYHSTSTEWSPAEESAFLTLFRSRGIKVSGLHIERQLAFNSTIYLANCRDTKIENATAFYAGNTFLKNYVSSFTEISSIYTKDERQSSHYDIQFIGTAAENYGYRSGPLDFAEESGTSRSPISNGAAVQGMIPWISGSYFLPASTGGSGTSVTLGNGFLRVYGIDIREVMSIAAMGAEVVTIGEAGSLFRVGIWTEKNGAPDKLINDFGTINGASATVQDATTGAPIVLTPGRYFVGGVVQNVTTTQPTMRICNAAVMQIPALLATKPTTNQLPVGYMQEGVTGPLGEWTAGRSQATSALLPRIHMKLS